MSTERIEENPSFKDLKEKFDSFQSLKGFLKFFSFLGLIDKNKFKEDFGKFEGMKKELEELSKIPDTFNRLFAKRGWIACESMKADILKEAIERAENESIEAGERILIEYFKSENLRWKIGTLFGTPEMKIRVSIINHAYDEFIERDYMSCIPLILMVIDGAVSDVNKKYGFFSEQSELKSWDSIAAHSTGLSVLRDLFFKGRNKTTSEQIETPFRNGILHGRDLGFANEVVATKCWSALFAVRDWIQAIRSEPKRKEKEPELPWRETLSLWNKVQESKKRLIDWKPRAVELGKDAPRSGEITDYNFGTPERTLVEFINYWKSSNYGAMAEQVSTFVFDEKSPSKRAGEIRRLLATKTPQKFEILAIDDQAAAITEISVRISAEVGEETIIFDHTFRLIYEDENNQTLVRGEFGGSWRLIKNFWNLEFIELQK
ncbi:hypothetical protein [Aquiflexum gelatinilyticum]|uniref:Uncharacterized protein n=1 Tax=Aquiflexum gelatinilyticum TaxID=2961943 RepID=A0A9X2P1G8_9BACT|nr:hypothetical protein [Aquiflexum gelatinilyticum]MCR9013809.1 hypothetical protein [Aquiflexum gelatinilyticum]